MRISLVFEPFIQLRRNRFLKQILLSFKRHTLLEDKQESSWGELLDAQKCLLELSYVGIFHSFSLLKLSKPHLFYMECITLINKLGAFDLCVIVQERHELIENEDTRKLAKEPKNTSISSACSLGEAVAKHWFARRVPGEKLQ